MLRLKTMSMKGDTGPGPPGLPYESATVSHIYIYKVDIH